LWRLQPPTGSRTPPEFEGVGLLLIDTRARGRGLSLLRPSRVRHGSLVVLETYADSSAHLSHMQADGHRELMGSLMALIDSLEFFVLGEPNAEHAEALAAVPGAQFYSELASK